MRVRRKVLPVLLFLVFAVPVFSQKNAFTLERLAVQPFVNQTGQEQWDNLARSISDTLLLTLRLTERLTVRDIGTFQPYDAAGREAMRVAAGESRLDAVLIGRIVLAENDRVRIEAEIYEPRSDQIVASEVRTAFGAFDVLDAADELVVAVAGGLTGYQVDFGALILKPDRTDVAFRVYLDGAFVGDNLIGIPQVLTGTRRIDITVVSRDREQLVYSADLTINPGEADDVTFSLPQVTRAEGDMIESRLRYAQQTYATTGAAETVQVALDEARGLLAGAGRDADDAKVARLQVLLNLEREFRTLDLRDYWDNETGFRAGTDVLSAALEAMDSPFADDPDVRAEIRRSALAHLYLLDICFGAALSESDWETSARIMDEMAHTRDRFQLGNEVLPEIRVAEFRQARETAEELRKRRRRPLPYLLTAIGAGGTGYGSWLFYSDAVGSVVDEADTLYRVYEVAGPDTVAAARNAAEDSYQEAEELEIVQWASIAGGAAILATGVALAVRNIRRSENSMRDWAENRYRRLMTVSTRILAYLSEDRTDSRQVGVTEAELLILGPQSLVLLSGSVVDTPPLLVAVPPGSRLPISRPTVIPQDGLRTWESGLHMVVVE